jgi:uncharacterized repeat protein (TIGR03803 family)
VTAFGSGTDPGSYPAAGLAYVNGTLYGTTVHGGSSNPQSPNLGLGTVFAVSKSGTERVLHSFTGRPDGAYPYAGLISVNGTLYGTTSGGGANGYGTVFAVSTSGAERVLYSFKGGTDGANPQAGPHRRQRNLLRHHGRRWCKRRRDGLRSEDVGRGTRDV